MSVIIDQPITYGRDSSLARFSVDRYQKMIETGILTPEDRVELLENYIVLKMTRNPLHDCTIQKMLETLFLHRRPGWSLRVQSAITLADSQPEPDFAVVRGSASNYQTNHPIPGDIGLVIEVADTSLMRDRLDKTRIYARAEIPCYWLVNVVDRRIETYSLPSGASALPSYGAMQQYSSGDEVPMILDGQEVCRIAADDLLP